MCIIKRETPNYILKFREIIPWREKVLTAHEMQYDQKPYFCQIYAFFFFEKWFMLWLTGILFISEGFWRFFLTQGNHW